MKDFIKQYFSVIEWTLGIFVVVVSIVAWTTTRSLSEGLTINDIFPPLGLIAFGLMWTHFVMGALRRYSATPKVGDSPYQAVSMGLVLSLILLHPVILWIQLYQDGFGLPPISQYSAYSGQFLAIALGTLALIIFLMFELKRFFGKKTWWKYIEYAQIVGMAAIFYHAISLGGELQLNWFMLVWWFYGVTLVGAVIYSEIRKRNVKNAVVA